MIDLQLSIFKSPSIMACELHAYLR